MQMPRGVVDLTVTALEPENTKVDLFAGNIINADVLALFLHQQLQHYQLYIRTEWVRENRQ